MADLRSSSRASMAARTEFASWPITGRSSAESLPICFKTAVSSPFLPRSFTRSSSRALGEEASSSACRARFLISSNCCFMLCSPFSGNGGANDKKPFLPKIGDERPTFRGTTRNSPKGALMKNFHFSQLITKSPGAPYCFFRRRLLGESPAMHASGFHLPALSVSASHCKTAHSQPF